MWRRVILILSVIFTLGTAYSLYGQEEFERLSAAVEQRFFKAHNKYVETGVMSEELEMFYREFRFPDHLRYKEISEYPEDFGVRSFLVISFRSHLGFYLYCYFEDYRST